MCRLTYIQFFVSYNSIKLKAGRKDEKEEAAQFFPKMAMLVMGQHKAPVWAGLLPAIVLGDRVPGKD